MPESSSTSGVPSRAKQRRVPPGPQRTDEIMELPHEAWASPFTTKSNLAKASADEVAACASAGWITTRRGLREFTRTWRVTPEGLEVLWKSLKHTERSRDAEAEDDAGCGDLP